MSDFLTQLAELALGLAPRVEPKLPRRFAAVAPLIDPSADAWGQVLTRYRKEPRPPAPPARPVGPRGAGDE